MLQTDMLRHVYCSEDETNMLAISFSVWRR